MMPEAISSAEFERFAKSVDDKFDDLSKDVRAGIKQQARYMERQDTINGKYSEHIIRDEIKHEELDAQMLSMSQAIEEISLTVSTHAPVIDSFSEIKKKYTVLLMGFLLAFSAAAGTGAYVYIVDPEKLEVKKVDKN